MSNRGTNDRPAPATCHVHGRAGRHRLVTCLAACLFLMLAPVARSQKAEPTDVRLRHLERLDDPYRPRPATPPPGIPAGRAVVERDGFVSVQVNVDEFGNNIPGDAANEPTIAVDPTDPSRIVIGWRQFDTIESNFRQAGVAYSHDAGKTWTFPGVLTPGVFRSDPVVVADADGRFHYLSLQIDPCYFCELFTSTDGGVTWGDPVFAYGGDKAWMTVDTTDGIGRNNLYQSWTEYSGCGGGTSFARSTDGGASFSDPLNGMPHWGTLTVDLNGTLYAAGTAGVVKSENAQDPDVTPTFTEPIHVELYGTLEYGPAPNPDGLGGQMWIRTDRSNGPFTGDLYVLASVAPDSRYSDEVMFARSIDGGETWSEPVRVNDDPAGTDAWHWFGTMDVAPDGRIDAVWNDTRNTGKANLSELFYSYSLDGGHTWAENIPVSPVFDSHVGWPNQYKIGDYYGMVSDNLGTSVAYAATFNGEQDVYFLRIEALDCNHNGILDNQDLASGFSHDCNGDQVPDECQPDCNHDGEPDVCQILAGAPDCDGNMQLDQCQADIDGDGIIDPCDDDIDGDGVPNAEDVCPYAPVFGPALADGMPTFSTDDDCGIDLWDYWRMFNCIIGGRPDVPPPPECYERFDVDFSGTIDLRDFAVFQVTFTGDQ